MTSIISNWVTGQTHNSEAVSPSIGRCSPAANFWTENRWKTSSLGIWSRTWWNLLIDCALVPRPSPSEPAIYQFSPVIWLRRFWGKLGNYRDSKTISVTSKSWSELGLPGATCQIYIKLQRHFRVGQKCPEQAQKQNFLRVAVEPRLILMKLTWARKM